MTPSDPSGPPPLRRKIIPVPPRPRGELNRMVMEEQIGHDLDELGKDVRRGTHWFYWVAALSLVNSIIALAGGHVTFLAGLAVSQIIDGLVRHMSLVGPYISIGIDLIFAFFLCGFGYLASHGSRAALIAGMILYALDGMIFLLFGAVLPALFHAFVLYRILPAWQARRKLEALQTDSPTPEPCRGALSRHEPVRQSQ